MAPKKEKAQKLTLNEFMNDDAFGGGNWADEVEETYGTQPLPSTDRARGFGNSSYGGGSGDRFGGSGTDRYAGHSRQEREEIPIPDKPPYTAHLGNLSYDVNQEAVTSFFTNAGCEVLSVRIVEDRAEGRPKGYGYAEFSTPDGLRKALTLSEANFFSRNIRIRVADPPKDKYGNESNRDLSDWSRKGPLPDAPRANNRSHRDFNEPREFRDGPREHRAAGPDYREMSWERKGPLSPALPPPMERGGSRTGSRSGHRMGDRSNSFANRGASPAAWGPGEGRQDSRPPPREPRERLPTAAEQDNAWRSKMRPDPAPGKSPIPSRSGSEAPPSPAPAPAAPAGRPKLNLQKRTVSEAPGIKSPTLASDSKASPFGAARPIDTAAREREIEEKRIKAEQERKEAEEKANEENQLPKEAAAGEAAGKAAIEAIKPIAEAMKPLFEAAKPAVEAYTQTKDSATEPVTEPAAAHPAEIHQGVEKKDDFQATQNGITDAAEKFPTRPRGEARDPREIVSSRATDSGNWRSGPGSRGGAAQGQGDRRGGGAPRGGRPFDERQSSRRGQIHGYGYGYTQNQELRRGSDQQPSNPTTPVVDAEGWTTVSGSAKGRRGRPVVS